MLHRSGAAQANGAAQSAFDLVAIHGWRRQCAQRRSFHGVEPGKGVEAHQRVVGRALQERVEVDLLDPSTAFEAHDVDGLLHGGHGVVPTVAGADRRPFVTDVIGGLVLDAFEDLADVHRVGAVVDEGDDGEDGGDAQDDGDGHGQVRDDGVATVFER